MKNNVLSDHCIPKQHFFTLSVKSLTYKDGVNTWQMKAKINQTGIRLQALFSPKTLILISFSEDFWRNVAIQKITNRRIVSN